MRKIGLLIIAFALLACILHPELADVCYGAVQKAGVTEIKHWSNPSYTRIAITLNGKAEYSHRLLKKDPSINIPWRRLYVDIKGARLGKDIQREIPIHDGLLKAARAAEFDKDTVRVVLDIESIEEFKIFHLNDPYRIIIDVTGKKGASKAQPPKEAESQTPSLSQQLGLKVKRIVIDAGHGGKDSGAVGKGGLQEKDVTLKLAQLLKSKLAGRFEGNVVMTRDKDVFIPLEERTAIANSKDADLFISIHVNASPRRTASGVETYILNISRDEESRRVAARENATSTRSVSDLEFILNDLIKTAKMNDSSKLASEVNSKLVARLAKDYDGVKSNGVKGAPFYVLVGTKMPSILVEVSFISNPTDEKRMKDEKYLRAITDGIYDGVAAYLNGAATL
ncbi:MAG: N-acetylmuramoyl-L-alanine amidase [Deltaproteobacteria bacterium]|nr:N-acetylmuramoyl-L-alanine amidase [Deltaproteobacteria bacterium]